MAKVRVACDKARHVPALTGEWTLLILSFEKKVAWPGIFIGGNFIET